jgi:F-box protein 21
MPSLDDFPDEIIRQILEFLSPQQAYHDALLVSKRFHRLATEPLLWRHYCQISFDYWHWEHGFGDKLATRASKTQWRALWRRRQYRNDLCARLLNEIIATKVGRVAKLAKMSRMGYDVKDFLLEQIRTPDNAEDVLARR